MNNLNSSTLTYSKVGDYYIPDLALDGQLDKEIGAYGRMREQYLEEHYPGRYGYLISSGKLFSHLLEIDEAAQNYLDTMIPSMAAAAGVTEELKARDRMSKGAVLSTRSQNKKTRKQRKRCALFEIESRTLTNNGPSSRSHSVCK